jgi:hypothetical protein
MGILIAPSSLASSIAITRSHSWASGTALALNRYSLAVVMISAAGREQDSSLHLVKQTKLRS